MPSKEFAKVQQMIRSRPAREGLTLQERRALMEEGAKLFPAPGQTQYQPVDAAGIPAEWIIPDGAGDRTLLYLHGGGYLLGSIKTHRVLAALLAAASGARALIIDYRLAPEHPFPAAVEDTVATYRWLLAQGISSDRIVIGGDSAGGGLAIAAMVSLRDEGQPLPATAVCLSPWTDLEITGDALNVEDNQEIAVQREALLAMAKTYLGGADPRHPLASPIHAALQGLPPLYIQAGGAETLLDDATRLARNAQDAGVDVEIEIWDDMFHVWQAYAPILPEGRQAIDKIGGYIKKRLPQQRLQRAPTDGR